MAEQTDLDRNGDPLRVMRSRWLVCLLAATLGALAGAALSTQHVTRTTAEARLAVGSQGLDAFQVGSYAEASQKVAANYARFVRDSPSSVPALDEALGDAVRSITAIAASPIPDSNVLRIEVTATNPRAAVLAAQTLADNLREQANATSSPSVEDLLGQHKDLAAKVAVQRAKVERRRAQLEDAVPGDTPEAKSRLMQAEAHLANLQLQLNVAGLAFQQSQISDDDVEMQLEEIQPAAVTGDDERRTLQLYTVTGLLLGLALGAVLANLLPRRTRRRATTAMQLNNAAVPDPEVHVGTPRGSASSDRTS